MSFSNARKLSDEQSQNVIGGLDVSNVYDGAPDDGSIYRIGLAKGMHSYTFKASDLGTISMAALNADLTGCTNDMQRERARFEAVKATGLLTVIPGCPESWY